MNAEFITEALRQHYAQRKFREQWAFFGELRLGTGYADISEKRIDAFVLNLWPSKNYRSISFEIKISRGDFKKEVKDPMKRYPGMMISNEFYFVTPPSLISVDELPEYCGLMEVNEESKLVTVRRAVYRPKMNPTWNFISSICRRVIKQEEVEL